MSVITRIHDVFGRLFGIAEQDTEEFLNAVAEHLAPIVQQARAELLTDVKKLIDEGKVDATVLAAAVVAEVDKILGHTSVPAEPAPAPPAAPEAPTTTS
jgi:hypothetical protein